MKFPWPRYGNTQIIPMIRKGIDDGVARNMSEAPTALTSQTSHPEQMHSASVLLERETVDGEAWSAAQQQWDEYLRTKDEISPQERRRAAAACPR
jgi:hypothetical protein